MGKKRAKSSGTRKGPRGPLPKVTGRLGCNPGGYGFVKPEDGEGPDIYVSKYDMADAVHRDLVEVRVKTERDGRKSGKIAKIIERGKTEITGFFNDGYVTPRDRKVNLLVKIKDTPGPRPKNGDVVNVNVTSFPKGMQGASGEVIEILGKADQPEMESKIILSEHGFSEEFPKPVLNQARSIGQKVLPAEMKGREDLRNLFTVTIDPKTARDFDDAVSIKRTDRGFTLWVSIADVSHYVQTASPMDKEAYKRGTSVYFPDRAIHMLPEELSAGIVSLKPRVNRLAMTAEIQFDNNGSRNSAKFYPSVIRSDYRLTYEEVEAILIKRDTAMRKRYADLVSPLRDMLRLAKLRIERRQKRGSLDMDIPEPDVILDKQGQVTDIVRHERLFSHRIVEEFMLVANEAVAEFLTESKLALIYRIHEPPAPKAVESFAEFLARLGLRLLDKKQDPERIKPHNYQRLFKSVAGKPEEPLVSMLALRSMMQARYSTENKGHFGLAADYYCHFTSPIRRYPDLVVHRILKQRSGFSKQALATVTLEAAASQSSERERAAVEAEREMIDVYGVRYMSTRLGQEFTGIISGLTDFGMFVLLDQVFIEGMVPLDTMDDEYIYEQKDYRLRGRARGEIYTLGMGVRVRVEAVNLERRQVDFRVIGKT